MNTTNNFILSYFRKLSDFSFTARADTLLQKKIVLRNIILDDVFSLYTLIYVGIYPIIHINDSMHYVTSTDGVLKLIKIN